MLDALRRHWPEYSLEAFGLGLFMVSAVGFAVLLFHPGSPVVAAVPDPWLRGALMGTAMGLTNVVNVYAPWGRRSGAHLNPAVTLTFLRLGKIRGVDAVWYTAAQFVGGVAGTGLGVVLFRRWVSDPSVNYVATAPGMWGIRIAFLGELGISLLLMLVVLLLSNTPRLARYTGLAASLLVALYITLEAPVSGMSMNPARTLGSAAWAHHYTGLWIYFLAPPLGMLLASEVYLRARGSRSVFCAKLHHDHSYRCIFCESRR
jgi:aquaporin Z